ncbi:MAG: hypothetical protein ABIP75_07075, partial [Pyrinomonadaceae bacterium]
GNTKASNLRWRLSFVIVAPLPAGGSPAVRLCVSPVGSQDAGKTKASNLRWRLSFVIVAP